MMANDLVTAIAGSAAQAMAGDGGTGAGLAMMAAMIAVGAMAIAALVWLIRRLLSARDASRSHGGSSPESAVDILERRFAAREIDGDEYRERRSALERSR